MDPQLKQRLVGAAVLLSLAVIFLPLILSGPPPSETQVVRKEIPLAPRQDFESRVLPLTEPRLNPPVTKVVIGADEDEVPPASAPAPAPLAKTVPAPPPAPTPIPAPTAVAAPKPTADSADLRAWAVQAGSFTSEENALSLSHDLRKKGFSAFTQDQVNSKGVKIWFVRVGPELERADAETLMARLRGKQGLKDAYVVRYP